MAPARFPVFDTFYFPHSAPWGVFFFVIRPRFAPFFLPLSHGSGKRSGIGITGLLHGVDRDVGFSPGLCMAPPYIPELSEEFAFSLPFPIITPTERGDDFAVPLVPPSLRKERILGDFFFSSPCNLFSPPERRK